MLRHFGMVIHPPMLYLGFVGFTIPFAFAMSALASGESVDGLDQGDAALVADRLDLLEHRADTGRTLGL